VDGDERVQAGSPTAPDDDVLVIEGLRVAFVSRGGARARRVHGVGGGDPVLAVPVGDPVPVAVPVVDDVPVVAPVEAGVVEPAVALVPAGVLDVVSPVVLPAAVVLPVPELAVPVDEVAVEESVDPVVPLAGSLGLTPPALVPTEIPPVAGGAFLRALVVVVEEEGLSFVLAALEFDVCADSSTAGAGSGRAGTVNTGSMTAGASLPEVVTAVLRTTGLGVWAIATAGARPW
jgi:hypothetical protein